MTEAREFHTATLLPDGKVMIAGGTNTGGSLNTANVYDPATGAFTATAGNMNTGRRYHTATLLADGKVLLAGGYSTGTAEVYDPASRTFSATSGAMMADRCFHTATVLLNGKVLIAGGYNAVSKWSSAELYDPATRTFAATGSMTSVRWGHVATLLPDGKVLIAGGVSNTAMLNTAEVYDPATGTFTATTGVMSAARRYHTATPLQNGKVLVAGGETNKADVYDPATGTFSATAASMTKTRTWHTATLLPDGRVLLAGGDSSVLPNTAELYDPAIGTFVATVGTMTTGRSRHTATLLASGVVMLAGGNNNGPVLASAELYDSASWTFAATAGSMTEAREYHTATLLPDGKVLLAGGANTGGSLNTANVYDPATGVFTATAGNLSTSRRYHTATLLSDGKVLLAGGYGTGAAAEVYDPATRTFSATAGAMTAERSLHTATLLSNGKVLVAGGYNNAGSKWSSTELYDPATGTFTVTGSMTSIRFGHTATLLPDGKVLIAGGNSSTAKLNTAELYDPATGAFTATTGTMASARRYHTATLLPNGKVLLAGGEINTADIYDPATGTFTATAGTMTATRTEHTETLLQNGKVLLTGGDSSVLPNTAELFDPASRTFTTVGKTMNSGRCRHTASLLPSGEVLIAGGGNNGPVVNTAELYRQEYALAAFTATAGSMTEARELHTATPLPEGKVLIAGGTSPGGLLNTANVYDPATGAFAATAGNMNTYRNEHSATLLADGKVLLAGGYSTGTAEVYDPATRTFSATSGVMTADRCFHTATLLPNGKVLIAGGYNAVSKWSSAELYDPATRTFTATGSMTSVRWGHAATLLPDGKVLIAGGNSNTEKLNTAEVYDPATETFTATAGVMSAARRYHTATQLHNAKVLLAGGEINTADVYDPATGTFTATAGSMTTTRTWHTGTLLPDGRVLLAGGDSSGIPNTAELYDPAIGTFVATTGSMTTGRYRHTATLLASGEVLLAGGNNNGPVLASAELFDCVNNRPAVDAPPVPIVTGQQLSLTGSGFRGYRNSEASGGATNSSATNYPLAVLRSIDSGQTLWLQVAPATPGFTATTLTTGTIGRFSGGPALLTVIVNGVPSVSRYVTVEDKVLLTVSVAGSGSGGVSANVGVLSWSGATGTALYNRTTSVTLTAAADTGSTFTAWGGACAGAGACVVAMDAAKSVTATFTKNQYSVTATATGTGSGAVSSNAGGISYSYPTTSTGTSSPIAHGTAVTLTATAAANASASWTTCSGTASGNGTPVATCAYTALDGTKSAQATFARDQYSVTATATGNGAGAVSSTTGGIGYSYPTTTSGTSSLLSIGTAVTLTATAATGSTVAWTTCTGTASGNGTQTATCAYSSLDGSKTAQATFTLNSYSVTATATGAGSGSVSSTSGGISFSYPTANTGTSTPINYGAAVTLTATAATGSNASWTTCTGTASGNGTQTATCSYATLDGTKTAQATFAKNQYSVTATATGTGTGTVSSTVGGISYGYPTASSGTTSAINHGTAVTLRASASYGSTASWTTCTGTASGGGTTYATCSYLSLDGAKTAQATFTKNQYTVTASAAGVGTGTVSSSAGGISYSYPTTSTGTTSPLLHGTSVTLTARASDNTNYAASWTTCSGSSAGNSTQTATCVYSSLTGNKTAQATFVLKKYSVTASAPGGNGTITCSPILVEHGSTTSCTATPAAAYQITSLSGCGGTDPGAQPRNAAFSYSTGAITAACAVTAAFAPTDLGLTYTLTTGSTNVDGGAPIAVNPADKAGLSGGTTEFSRSYDSYTTVTLTAPAAAGVADGSTFARWYGCDSVNDLVCTVAMTDNKMVTAKYNAPSGGWQVMRQGIPAGATAVWGTGPGDIFAVGPNSAILHYNGSAWSLMTSGTSLGAWGDFTGVWGSSSSDVFVVGSSGTILHYNGSRWSPTYTAPGSSFTGIWGSSSSDVFVTSASGEILRYNGSTWLSYGMLASGLKAIWGTSSSDVFAVGPNSAILHFDGLSWTPMFSPADMDFRGVWGSSSSNVYAIGRDTFGSFFRIMHFDGLAWTEAYSYPSMYNPPYLEQKVAGIWGSTASDVYAVGSDGAMLHFDGFGWSMMSGVPQNYIAGGIWGSSSNDVFLAVVPVTEDPLSPGIPLYSPSPNLTFMHFNGAWWAPLDSTAAGAMCGVWGSSSNDVFAVGTAGTILHYDGSGWSPVYSGTNELRGVWGSSSNDVFAVGTNGTILHYDGSSWSQSSYGVMTLNAVSGSSPSNVYAVGSNGTILQYLGAGYGWSAVYTGDTSNFTGVFVSSWDRVYVVGGSGITIGFDGISWSLLGYGPTLNSAWGLSSSDVYAVGMYSYIFKWDNMGLMWQLMSSVGPSNLYGIWGSSPGDLFAVGDGATILHYNGSAWSPMNSGVPNRLYGISELRGVWGSSSSDVFAVGEAGTILHYAPPVLTVSSTNPASGVSIGVSLADNAGHSGGTTPLSRVFAGGTTVALSAPATAGGKDFAGWSGCDTVADTVCTVTIWSDTSVTANFNATVDVTAPTVTSATSTTADGQYKAGVAVNVTVNFSETVSSTGLTINLDSGGSVSTGTLSNVTNFSGTYTVGAGQTSADLSVGTITGTITDAAANDTVNPAVPVGQNIADAKAIVIDTTAPAVAIGAPSAAVTKSGPVSHTVTYTDTTFNASTLAVGNVTLNKTGTADGTVVVAAGSGATRTVTVSGATGDGTLGISLDAGTATDVAGNAAPAAGPGTSFQVDNTAPVTTASPLGGTHQTPANVTLSCNDGAGGGCGSTVYCTGSGCTPTTPYSYPAPIYIAATTDLRYQSTDIAGNTEAVKTQSYIICTFTVAPTSIAMPASFDLGSITVTTQPGCTWTATKSDSWISITAGFSGGGSGVVQFSVAANTAAGSRSGTIAVAGTDVTITQAGLPLAASFVGRVGTVVYENPFGPAPLSVLFDAAGSIGPNPITNYHWEFGDGGSADSAATTVEHNYPATGSYFVTLTVTDSLGRTDITERVVSVADLIQFASTSAELQTALDNAGANGMNDIIRLAGGIYGLVANGDEPFTHVATESKDLVIEGGWTGDFSWRGSNITSELKKDGPYAWVGTGGVLGITAGGGVTLDGVSISGGSTPGSGGGLYVTASGPVVVGNSRIINNTSGGEGGGLYLESTGSFVWLYGSTIKGNGGANGGGGVIKGQSAYVSTNEIAGNTASLADGGLRATVSAGGELIVSNNTIYDNQATLGSAGLAVSATGTGGIGLLDVHNNIVYGNYGGGIAPDFAVAADCDYLRDYLDLNIVNNDIGTSAICADYPIDGSNVSVDFSGRLAGDIRLAAADTALIDQGTQYDVPWEDFEGDAIPLDGDADTIAVPDIGADEYNPADVSGPASMTATVSGPITTVGGSATITVTLDKAAKRDVVLYLASSDAAVATPATPYLKILRGRSSAQTTVQAHLDARVGGATVTATDPSGKIAQGSVIVIANINVAPTLGTLTPSALNTKPDVAQSFTAVFSDANGYAGLKQVKMLINANINHASAISMYYDLAANKLYLRNDANTSWGVAATPGPGMAALSNGQGTIGSCTVSGAGNNLTLNLTITPKATFSSETRKNVYLAATDSAGLTTGWVDKGDWTILPSVAPTLGALTPAARISAPGAAQSLTAVYSDANGYEDLKQARLLVNTNINNANAISIYYDRVNNKLYLRNDGNSSWGTGATPGPGMATLANSQGTIGSCTVSGAGNNLTLSLMITPKNAFSSITMKNIYLAATDLADLTTGWVDKGDWTIFNNAVPTLGALTPSLLTSAAGTTLSFKAVFSDANGYADLRQANMLINTNINNANAISLKYDRISNKLYLMNDDNTGWGAGVSVGPGMAVLSNSQGVIESCTVTGAGNDLTLDVTVTPKAHFVTATKKNIYLNATDISVTTTGWVDKGDWTIY